MRAFVRSFAAALTVMVASATGASTAWALPTITEYTSGLTASSAPKDAVLGPDGNVWFTESGGSGAIGRITPSGTISQFTVGLTPNSSPRSITVGPDGALWFTESAAAKIGRITTGGGITEHALPGSSNPGGITSGPDGNLWFTDSAGGGAIGKITTSGQVTEYTAGLSNNARPA